MGWIVQSKAEALRTNRFHFIVLSCHCRMLLLGLDARMSEKCDGGSSSVSLCVECERLIKRLSESKAMSPVYLAALAHY